MSMCAHREFCIDIHSSFLVVVILHREGCSDSNRCASIGESHWWSSNCLISLCICVCVCVSLLLLLSHSFKAVSTAGLLLLAASTARLDIPYSRDHPPLSLSFILCMYCVCTRACVHVCVCYKDSLAHFLAVLIINFPWCLGAPVWLICPRWASTHLANVEQATED